jgi:pantoate--beta-alanine ligase
MHHLLNIIPADNLYLGQKDYQQCMVLKKLVEIINRKTIIIICPTLRELDGLAMSSRNMRLSETERQQAVQIYKTLNRIKEELKPGNLSSLKAKAANYLSSQGFKVDYVEIADAATLDIKDEWDGQTPLVVLCAAFLNEVRLIDNLLLLR